jgi:hypothetical protein
MAKLVFIGWLSAFMLNMAVLPPAAVLEMSPVDPAPVVIFPGKMVTIAVKVANLSGEPAWATALTELPPSWRAISDSKPFLLEAGETDIRLLTVVVPPRTLAGDYRVLYYAKGTGSKPVSGECTLFIRVTEFTKLEISALEAPGYVVAGEDIEARFIVRNLSNFEQNIHLQTHNCQLVGGETFSIPTDSSRIVIVKAGTLAQAAHVYQQTLRVDAHIAGKYDYAVSAFENVEVIPPDGGVPLNAKTLPLMVRLSYLTRQKANGEFVKGFQGELFGKVEIGEEGGREVELHLRGPDRFSASSIGFYDEYYASYSSPGFNLFAGDKTFSLTTLTEFARYGRGIEGSMMLNGVEVGGFYHAPRFYNEIKDEAAGYLRFHFNKDSRLGFNMLKKSYDSEGQDARIFSVNGAFSPLPNTQFEAEISSGFLGTNRSNAVYLQASSNPVTKLNVYGLALYAGKDYPGYYTNTVNYAALLNYRVTKRLDFSASMHQDEINAEYDTLFATAPFSQMVQVGFGLQLDKSRSQLRGFLVKSEIMDRMPARIFHYQIRSYKLQAFRSFHDFEITLTGEIGERTNFAAPAEFRHTRDNRGAAELTWRASGRLSFQGFVNYLAQTIDSSFYQKQWIYGIDGSGALTKSTTLRLHLQNSFQIEDYFRNRSLAELNLIQRIGRNQELALTGRYTLLQRTAQDKDAAVSLVYTWRPQIPLVKKKNLGTVTGFIRNDGVKNIANIRVLLNGRSGVTGKNGFFEFKNVYPGKYYLMLDKSTTGLHDVPATDLPIEINVEAGLIQNVEFGLTTGASINGTVQLQKPESQVSILEDEQPLGPVVLELRGGTTIMRQVTDEEGNFAFTDLRPGNWKVRIISSSVPKNHFLEKEFLDLALDPGENKNVVFRIFEKEKNIRFNQEWLHIGTN